MKSFIAYTLVASGLTNLAGYFFGMIIAMIFGRIVWLVSPQFRKSSILWITPERKKYFDICMGVASGFGAAFAAALVFHFLSQSPGLAVLLIIVAWKILDWDSHQEQPEAAACPVRFTRKDLSS